MERRPRFANDHRSSSGLTARTGLRVHFAPPLANAQAAMLRARIDLTMELP